MIFVVQTVNVFGQFDCRIDDPIPLSYKINDEDSQQFRILMDSLAKANGIFTRDVSPAIDSLVLINYDQHIAKLRSLQKKSIIEIPPHDYKALFVKTKQRTKHLFEREILLSEVIVNGENLKNRNWSEFIITENPPWTEIIYFSYGDKYLIVVKCEDRSGAMSDGNIVTTYFLEKI